MIKFNELSINKDSNGDNRLNIDVQVLQQDSAFDLVYINRIIIIKAEDYDSSLDPSTSITVTPVFDLQINTANDILKYYVGAESYEFDNNTGYPVPKHIVLHLTEASMTSNVDFYKDMYVVYVYTGSLKSDATWDDYWQWDDDIQDYKDIEIDWTSPKTPGEVCCKLSKTYDTGIVFNMCRIYNALMQNIKQLDSKCDCSGLPLDFMNVYMNYIAIKYAIMTCNYTDAIARYNKMFNHTHSSVYYGGGCGCNK